MKDADDQVPSDWIGIIDSFAFNECVSDLTWIEEKRFECVSKPGIQGEEVRSKLLQEQTNAYLMVGVFLTTIGAVIMFLIEELAAIEAGFMFPSLFHLV